MRFILLAFGLIAADQASKWLIMDKLAPGQSVSVIDRIFYVTYVQNPGAAFGMFPYKTVFFVGITLAVILGVIFFARSIPRERILLKTGLALQFGGAVGNLIDRLRFGHVVDFFDFRVWPVFNIADMAIVAGVGILILEQIRSEKSAKKGEASSSEEPAGS